MQAGSTIQYLRHTEINKQLWDRCIDNATNGLVYCYSFYLDKMATNWDGLVLNNYEAVMPLPFRKKFGVYYLYQPFLAAQLGIFGAELNSSLVTKFLNAIPRKFSYWDLSMNHGNVVSSLNFPLYERSNYVLDLSKPYNILYQNYRENIRRNIKKARDHGCYIKTAINVDDVIALAKQQTAGYNESDFENFKQLYSYLQSKSQAKTYGVFSPQNELVASCVFFFSHKRAYYILVGNHPNGRTLGASHLLIDGFIKDHAEQDLKLDFEGSDIRNLAFFYSSFGATEEKYAAIKLNRLPWWAKWLKK